MRSALVAAVIAVAAATVGTATPAFAQDVPASLTLQLTGSAVGADPTALPDCDDAAQVPPGVVLWVFTLAGTNDDDVVVTADAIFLNGGTRAIETPTGTVTSAPDTLVSGTAVVTDVAGDDAGPVWEASACFEPDVPPPPPPPETTTTTTTTTPPPSTDPPPTEPPPTSPPTFPPSSAPAFGGFPSAPPPRNATEVLQSAVTAPLARLPLFGLGFGRSVGTSTPSTPPTTVAAGPATATDPSTSSTPTSSKDLSSSNPVDREQLNRTQKIDGAATAVRISGAKASPWRSLAFGVIGATMIVFLIVAITRRSDPRARLRRPPPKTQ
jgi:hypothetical protein